MAREFLVRVLTPGRELFSGEATEVLLPAYDGEVGVLSGHGDFIGALGTGPLKVVSGGNDFWFMLSSGAYRVKSCKLTILAEVGEKPSDSDGQEEAEKARELEAKLADIKSFSTSTFDGWKREFDRSRARIEIHRRTESVN